LENRFGFDCCGNDWACRRDCEYWQDAIDKTVDALGVVSNVADKAADATVNGADAWIEQAKNVASGLLIDR